MTARFWTPSVPGQSILAHEYCPALRPYVPLAAADRVDFCDAVADVGNVSSATGRMVGRLGLCAGGGRGLAGRGHLGFAAASRSSGVHLHCRGLQGLDREDGE